ncbi:hypothetical protein DXG01_003449 [Tephrocybe rancida]|nr:hypothetical protein DXG01_003449 [Tephrocybe rancida]
MVGLRGALDIEETEHLLRVLHSTWTKMWPWMDTLYRRIVLEDDGQKGDLSSALIIAVGRLLTFMAEHPKGSEPETTPGTLWLAVKMFVDTPTHPPEIEELVWRLRFSEPALIVLLDSPLSYPSEVIDAVGFNKVRAANSLFQPIHFALHAGQRQWKSSLGLLLLVHRSLCSRSPEFYRSLPSRTVMSHLCDCLAYFVHRFPAGTESTDSILGNSNEIIAVIVGLLEIYAKNIADGHSWIIYALRRDALGSLIQSARHLELYPHPSDLASSIEGLFCRMAGHAVHRPVWRILAQHPAMGRPLPARITNEMVISSWFILNRAVGYMKTGYDAFEQRYFLTCSSDMVPKAHHFQYRFSEVEHT